MANELAGKVGIVTGGGSGIGRGTAERFLAEGARIVIADIDSESGQSCAAELGPNVAFKQTDVSDVNQVRELVDFTVETFGGLHVMFNNAGISGARHARLEEEDFADFHRVMGVNLLGVMAGTREAARAMKAAGGGSIINVASIGGIQPAPGLWAYHGSKSAVIFFSRCAAVDLGEYAIRVNCLAPGNIETPILSSVMADNLPEEDREAVMRAVREYIISRQAIQRQGTTEDIAQAALYFASDRSSYVTGSLLPVDAGITAGVAPSGNPLPEIIEKARGK
jgi:NAD(P)-dependent dehydrogenase (short-subunit alcohol dehydrogenase family)